MPPNIAKLLGSKWTSTETLLGWRHFHVLSLRRGAAGWEAELAASVEQDKRLWLPVRELRDRARFAAGWAQIERTRAFELPLVSAEDAGAPSALRGDR